MTDIDVDDIAVERAMKGDRSIHLNRAELLIAFTTLDTKGIAARTIGELLGVSERSVTRWRSGVHTPRCRPAFSRWTAPIVTCDDCGQSMTTNAVRHRRRNHSGVA